MKNDHPDLSVRRRCSLLSLARSTLYYQPRGERAENLKFMEIIDRQFLETPWYGSRQMSRHMQRQGHKCGRHRVRLLVKADKGAPIQPALADWVAQVKLPGNLRLSIDIDPQSFL